VVGERAPEAVAPLPPPRLPARFVAHAYAKSAFPWPGLTREGGGYEGGRSGSAKARVAKRAGKTSAIAWSAVALKPLAVG